MNDILSLLGGMGGMDSSILGTLQGAIGSKLDMQQRALNAQLGNGAGPTIPYTPVPITVRPGQYFNPLLAQINPGYAESTGFNLIGS